MSNQDVCEIKPVKAFLSTNLNNKTKTFKDLADRIMRSLGYPIVSVELHRDMVLNLFQLLLNSFPNMSRTGKFFYLILEFTKKEKELISANFVQSLPRQQLKKDM